MNTRTLEEFAELRKRIDNELARFVDCIKSWEDHKQELFPETPDRNSCYLPILVQQCQRIKESVFKILVVGEFNAGKSTFLNTLLKGNILPTGVTPTQATINLIKYGECPAVLLHYWGERNNEGIEVALGRTEQITFDQLASYTTQLKDEYARMAQQIRLAEISYPTDYCKQGVEIVDTPGLNSTYAQHEQVTMDYLPNGHVGILILRASQAVPKSVATYLGSFSKYMGRMFFLLNYRQQESSEMDAGNLLFWSDQLQKVLGTKQPVKLYPVNLKMAQSGEWQDSGFLQFISEFETFLTSDERAKQMLSQPVQCSLSYSSEIEHNMEMAMNVLRFSPEEFNKRISDAQPQMENLLERKKALAIFIDEQNSLITARYDLSSKKEMSRVLGDVSEFIREYKGEMGAFPVGFQSWFKGRLVTFAQVIQDDTEREIGEFRRKATMWENEFRRDVEKYQQSVLGETVVSGLTERPISNAIEETGIPIAVNFGLGFLAGTILGGPIGWLAAMTGGQWISSWLMEKRRQDQLRRIEEEISRKVQTLLVDSVTEGMIGITARLRSDADDLQRLMNVRLTACQGTIEAIKQERRQTEDTITRRKGSCQVLITDLQSIQDELRKLLRALA